MFRRRFLTLIFSTGMVIATAIGIATTTTAAQPASPTTEELQNQKLQEEIRQLELENERLESLGSRILDLVPFFTVLIGVGGVLVTIWRQIDETRKREEENRQQRDKEMIERSRQQEEDRRQRERESLRDFDSNFTNVVQNLGSDSTALQASAAASLMTFLRPRYAEVLDEVLLVLIANLKIDRGYVVQDVLTRVFEQAIRLKLEHQQASKKSFSLDLSRSYLQRAELANLDLQGVEVDIAYANLRNSNLTESKIPRMRGFSVILDGARLSRADLREARLNDAHCEEALFHETILVSATLKQAKMRGAQFHQAQLQAAHLEDADLTDAVFWDADLNDTYFTGATLTDVSRRSIVRAQNWQKAHFDEVEMRRLIELASDSKSGATDGEAEGVDETMPPV